MKRVPHFILVIACIHSIHKDASEILTEYLEGIPHIKYEGTGLFTGTSYFVIKNSSGFHTIIENINSFKDAYRVIGYMTYEHLPSEQIGVTIYQKYSFKSSYNTSYLPVHMSIADSDLDKLIAITKG